MERIEQKIGQALIVVGITLIMGGMTDEQVHWRERIKGFTRPIPEIEAALNQHIQEIPGTNIALAGLCMEISGFLIAGGKKKEE